MGFASIYIIFSYIFVHAFMYFSKPRSELYKRRALTMTLLAPLSMPVIIAYKMNKK
ncbi:hypothetical protein [Pseudoalteromonas phage PS_L5]|nr:hypothetical protein [Pseudoalteromonas phage PS_L5]